MIACKKQIKRDLIPIIKKKYDLNLLTNNPIFSIKMHTLKTPPKSKKFVRSSKGRKGIYYIHVL